VRHNKRPGPKLKKCSHLPTEDDREKKSKKKSDSKLKLKQRKYGEGKRIKKPSRGVVVEKVRQKRTPLPKKQGGYSPKKGETKQCGDADKKKGSVAQKKRSS